MSLSHVPGRRLPVQINATTILRESFSRCLSAKGCRRAGGLNCLICSSCSPTLATCHFLCALCLCICLHSSSLGFFAGMGCAILAHPTFGKDEPSLVDVSDIFYFFLLGGGEVGVRGAGGGWGE